MDLAGCPCYSATVQTLAGTRQRVAGKLTRVFEYAKFLFQGLRTS